MPKLSKLVQSQEQELHRDRIARVYLGEISDPETQRRARERVDWIIEQVQGVKVLDVGCSEGITAIKLAERGLRVEAIDIHPEVIDYAQALATKMLTPGITPPVFRVQDLYKLEEIDPVFDTVILGEVIEHVYEPGHMLARAALALREGGRMIVTTPWGHFPTPDHHQTFYASNFLETIPPEMHIEHLSVRDSYIRFVARKDYDPRQVKAGKRRKKPEGIPPLRDLLRLSEAAALESQAFLRGLFEGQTERLRKSWEVAETWKERLKQQAEQSRVSLAGKDAEIAHLGEEKARHQAEMDKAAQDIARLQSDYDLLSRARDAAEQLLAVARTQLSAHELNLAAVRQALVDAQADFSRERQRLVSDLTAQRDQAQSEREAILREREEEEAGRQHERAEQQAAFERAMAQRNADAETLLRDIELQKVEVRRLADEIEERSRSEAALRRDLDQLRYEREAILREREEEEAGRQHERAEQQAAFERAMAQRNAEAETLLRDIELQKAEVRRLADEIEERSRSEAALRRDLDQLRSEREAILRERKEEEAGRQHESTQHAAEIARLTQDLGRGQQEAARLSAQLRETRENLTRVQRALNERLSLRRHARLVLRKRLSPLLGGRAGSAAPVRPVSAGSRWAGHVLRLHNRPAIRSATQALLPADLRRRIGNWFLRKAMPVPPARSVPPAPVTRSAPVGAPPPASARPSALRAPAPETPVVARSPAPKGPPEAELVRLVADMDFVVLANAYPSSAGHYGGEFVRTRAETYVGNGLRGAVVELNARNRTPLLDVSGKLAVLRQPVAQGDTILRTLAQTRPILLVHSPSPAQQFLLPQYIQPRRLMYWFHGFELRDYRRLYYNYTTAERETLRVELDRINQERRAAAWHSFENPEITKILVSEYLRTLASRDLGSPMENTHIIHNFVDGDFYTPASRPSEGPVRIMMLRPFKRRNYGTDIATRAIRLLADRPGFRDLSFTIMGFGETFREDTAPLAGLANVAVEEKYCTPEEMRALYQSHDIALVPTRHDTQGVSFGEAMASGLACISHDVAAIPEFADLGCTVLVRPDDPVAYAEAIWSLAHDRPRISRLGQAAAARVRAQCGMSATIARESSLIRSLLRT